MTRIDFHTHILPKMDDGSQSVNESRQMLQILKNDGVSTVALTPHFYPANETPESFFKRRKASYQHLMQECGDMGIEFLLGAEVAYFEGMRTCEHIPDLTIRGTGILLIEMPPCRWTERMFSEIKLLSQRFKITPMLAHIDRYRLSASERRLLINFVENGGCVQVNSESFTHWLSAGRLLKMMKTGLVHVLGSDCHNMKNRPPTIGKAFDRIEAADSDLSLRLEQIQNSICPCLSSKPSTDTVQ